jgi:hypothetical protein
MSNQEMDLILTAAVGPRIIRCGFLGRENEFYEFPETLGTQGWTEFVAYGGHRLWIAPEEPTLSYYPDNVPIEVQEHSDFIRARQSAEANLGITKELDVSLNPDANRIEITHRLINERDHSIILAPWALTIMNQGGIGIMPLPPRGDHPQELLPTSTISIWPYTNLEDKRLVWTERYIFLSQDPSLLEPQKVGGWVPDSWLAYLRDEHLFIKRFQARTDCAYPDLGSNAEMFTNGEILELESLGPLVSLETGHQVEHLEQWFLFKDMEEFATLHSAADFARSFVQSLDQLESS